MKAIFKPFIKVIKWLIFTNIYIAMAAVCLQAVICNIHFEEDWSYTLSALTFFGTWFIYQFSRLKFHGNYEVSEDDKTDEIYQFVDQNQNFTKCSIILSAIGALISIFYLSTETILLFSVLGVVSTVYSIKIGSFSLRSIPFIKIFLIAFVWTSISVWLPYIEIRPDYYWYEYLIYSIFVFLYIIFITLPFDINDISVDEMTGVKTIPSVFGISKTNQLIIILAIVLSAISILVFKIALTYGLILLMLLGLVWHSKRKAYQIEKWEIMAIYDGSMILLYLITMLSYKFYLIG